MIEIIGGVMGMQDTFTLKDVRKIFLSLSYRSLQVWVKQGVIIPAEPARKQGSASRFSYLNLIEIGLIMQLVKYGHDKHRLLAHLMRGAKGGKTRWIDGLNYDCFLLAKDFTFIRQPVPDPVHKTDGSIDQEATAFKRALQNPVGAWHILKHEELVALLVRPDFSGALVVDVRAIKNYVDLALI